MDDKYYGLLKADKTSYENFEVETSVSLQSVRLKEAIEEEQVSNLSVMRIIFGRVSGDGEYLLKVRDSGSNLTYLVRYEVGDEVRFQEIDFNGEENELK